MRIPPPPITLRGLRLASLLVLSACASRANPVFPGADPHVAVFGGEYWGYPTHTPDPGAQFHADGFMAYSSRDLVDWREHGPILRLADVPWIDDDGAPRHWLWAPGIVERGGRYYFYFSVGPQDPTPSRIGVAVADRPAGPFKDSGKPLVTGGDGFEAIDPMVFLDKDGTAYLYAGGSNGATLRVWVLKPSLVELDREIEVVTPPEFTEGAFMHEVDGTYYLSYSHGGWNRPDYSVHYATGKSAVGPWEYRGAILNSGPEHKGPGHHSFFRNPGSGQWYIAYHYWPTTRETAPLKGVRQTAIQPVTFGVDGTIPVIVPSDRGPEASPIR